MHIKQVFISGFRSFRSQTEFEPFSPKHNVIVGRNGSGKSNFFDAIQFVLLNQRFSSLRQEERQVLLHEGAGANVMTAYVELIFDNSDGRLAQDGDEVVLRRSIGLKKDEFFLNRKRVTKQEVSSLLESAGFSKSNPYYIVQQGKVSTLTLMKDAERLNLLKEVAGTKVYEERRQESLKIMEETKHKRDKIQEVISYIEERLSELEEEKEELGAYQKHDRQRRALEYTLYDKELQQASNDLDGKEAAMDECKEQIGRLDKELSETRARAGASEKRLSEDQMALAKVEKAMSTKEAERRELLGVRAKLESEVKDVSERVAADGDEQARLAEELRTLDVSIAAREEDLRTEAGPAFEKAKASVSTTEAELSSAQAQREELYERQGRGSQYRSAAERDAALKTKVRKILSSARGKEDTAVSLEKQIREGKEQRERQKLKAHEMEEQLRNLHAESQRTSADLTQKQAARSELADERKEKWRVLENLQDRISDQKSALEKSERDLRFSMPRNVATGLDALARLVKEQRIGGYYGPVFDNFELTNPTFATAVEVAGGNSIFNVIVDTDNTAAKLMSMLERRRLGRVTFMPLNRLKGREGRRFQIPPEMPVAHLIDASIKFRPEARPAMEQIFGKKLLAENLEVASTACKMADMDSITLDGDEVNRKGGMSGGYHDESSARLGAVERIRTLRRDLKGLDKDYKDMQQKGNEVDQAVTALLGEVQKLEAKRVSKRNVMTQTNKELGLVKRAMATTAEQVQEKEELLEQVRREGHQESRKADMLEAEIGTPLTATLSDANQRTLHELNTSIIPALNARLKSEFDALELAANARTRLVSLLNNNLLKRREEVRELLDPDKGGIGGSAKSGEAEERLEKLAQRREELSQTGRRLEVLRMAVEELEMQTMQQRHEMELVRKEMESLKQEEARLVENWEEENKRKDRLQGKQTVCIRKREDNIQKIQDLGSLPGQEREQYQRLSIKELMKKLHSVNESLKKYSHVNKKALDQYVSFSEQRETLLLRKKELDAGQAAIQELVDALDMQKDEAILRTFRGVSQNFSEVFQELVPSGSGQMIIKTSADVALSKKGKGGSSSESDEEEEEEEGMEDDESERGGEGEEEFDEDGQPIPLPLGKGKGKGKGKARSSRKKKKKRRKGKAEATGDEDPDDEGQKALSPSSVSDFVGVQVKVSFAAAGETFMMSQLSGGQKAVVALALIFAIQRCDPAPFYLFDEIDQALDSSYRAAVASLIQRQAHSSENPTQFITTTFRPEMVAVASRCYGISHQNKVSNIHELPREDALSFVANIMNEEEAVGVDLQQPSTPASKAAATRGRRQSAASASASRSSSKAPRRSSEAMDVDDDEEEEEEEDQGDVDNDHDDNDDGEGEG